MQSQNKARMNWELVAVLIKEESSLNSLLINSFLRAGNTYKRGWFEQGVQQDQEQARPVSERTFTWDVSWTLKAKNNNSTVLEMYLEH